MDKLYGLIQDINPKEICNHIENGNLAEWCNAWRIAAKEALQPKTNADRIRALDDEKLANYLLQFTDLDCQIGFCQNLPKCDALLDTEDGIPLSMCEKCLLKWLQKPAEVDDAEDR